MDDLEIHEIQRTMDTAECYIAGTKDGTVLLMCEREDCMVFGEPLVSARMDFWTEVLPYNCLPEFAVMRRAKHLATHDNIIEVTLNLNGRTIPRSRVGDCDFCQALSRGLSSSERCICGPNLPCEWCGKGMED